MATTTTELAALPVEVAVEQRARCSTCRADSSVTTVFPAGERLEAVDEVCARDRETALRLVRLCTHEPGQLGGLDA